MWFPGARGWSLEDFAGRNDAGAGRMFCALRVGRGKLGHSSAVPLQYLDQRGVCEPLSRFTNRR
jgi:hypothetical protein